MMQGVALPTRSLLRWMATCAACARACPSPEVEPTRQTSRQVMHAGDHQMTKHLSHFGALGAGLLERASASRPLQPELWFFPTRGHQSCQASGSRPVPTWRRSRHLATRRFSLRLEKCKCIRTLPRRLVSVMSNGPRPSQLCLLSALPLKQVGDKVRFLGW